MNLRNIFGKIVKHYRFQVKYTQEQLSEKADISTTYLSEIERGMHSLDFDKIEKLSNALNVEPFQLFLPSNFNTNLPRRIDMIKK